MVFEAATNFTNLTFFFQGTTGLEQKCTQFLTMSPGTVFHAPSHVEIRFVMRHTLVFLITDRVPNNHPGYQNSAIG